LFAGFILQFFLPKDHYFYYYINDAHVQPTTDEINKCFPHGIANDFILEKGVETKLEFSFNTIFLSIRWDRINLPDTPLVKWLSEANITYRQVNCYEICFQDFVQKYALKYDISEEESRGKEEVQNFNTETNCNNLCPLECKSSQYKISESKIYLVYYNEYS
jgi:hypothetical protein